MNKEQQELLEEAIQLELNMSKLYLFYRENFVEDKFFWSQIAKEEVGHAALLEVAKDFFDKYPKEIIYDNLKTIKKANSRIEKTIEKYKKQLPCRKEAYECAFDLENSAYELHYEKLICSKSDHDAIKTFKKLNGDDKNHAERIRQLIMTIK